jgi:hypothetical protein
MQVAEAVARFDTLRVRHTIPQFISRIQISHPSQMDKVRYRVGYRYLFPLMNTHTHSHSLSVHLHMAVNGFA